MISNKIYQATPEYGPTDKGGPILVVDKQADSTVELNARTDLVNHSPTGFGWGYNGSGPAQTALALLADVSGDDELALKHYMRFKDQIIQHQQGSWSLHSSYILGWLEGSESLRKSQAGEA